jgi:hypothetical protein
MKRISFSLLLIFLFTALQGQKPMRNFDVTSFNQKFKTVRWLADYDRATWQVLDALNDLPDFREKAPLLSNEWFCYMDRDSIWHAVLGTFDGTQYRVIYFLTLDKDFSVRVDPSPPPASFALPYATALRTAIDRLKRDHPDLPVQMNHYIRKNTDGTFTVWFFPSPFQNDMAIYGGEFSYTLDPSGTKILQSSGYYAGKFKGFPLDKGLEEITLDYTDIDEPTLGGIFFVWEYKELFKKIRLETSRSISSVLKDHTGEYYWIHVEK